MAQHPSATTNADGTPRTQPPRGAAPQPAPAPQPIDFGTPEFEIVTRTRICCDGGEGALGHPRVWLQIDDSVGWVDCGYCDKRYVLAGFEAAAGVASPGSSVTVGEDFGDRTDGDGLDEKVPAPQ